jgi:D-3-phosphoglycerate dehydrogenase
MELEMTGAGNSAKDPVVEALILDLLQWLASGERTYDEVMEAWRTSCPRLTVWEDANDRGLIASDQVHGRKVIRPSSSGLALLDQRSRRQRPEAPRTA